MDTKGEYIWQIRSSECGPDGAATLPAILNLLQEAASLNAEELGFSKSNFSEAGENISWVLTHIKVEMVRFPRWEESVRIVTWPRRGRKITAMRDFELFSSSGERLGAATTEWMVIDLQSRRAVPIPEAVFTLANDERAPVFAPDAFSRLKWDCAERPDALRFRAKRADIDLNGHVNNVHYAEWFLETVPADAGMCASCEIIFRSETLAGEEVLAEGIEVAPGEWVHRVSSPDGRDHVLARTRWVVERLKS